MSRFVDECLKEWKRLGVPQAVSEEMAADLAADLREAEAEGASPEHVLGNGVFDARTFAASWATARGVVRPGVRAVSAARHSPWTLAASAVASLFLAVVGLALVTRGHASIGVAPFNTSIRVPRPGTFVGPPGLKFVGPFAANRAVLLAGGAHRLVGLGLMMVGLVGLGLTLWLWKRWRPRPTDQRRRERDDNVALPSYL